MNLRKHINNTDVAIEILTKFYVRERDTWKLKVRWWNVGSRHAPFSMGIDEKLEIPASEMGNWKPYRYEGTKMDKHDNKWPNRMRTCNKCGTVAFGVSRSYAEKEVAAFNAYFDTLDAKGKDLFGNRNSSILQYEGCWCGNSYRNFRPAVQGDCPVGCTLQPIIYEEGEA